MCIFQQSNSWKTNRSKLQVFWYQKWGLSYQSQILHDVLVASVRPHSMTFRVSESYINFVHCCEARWTAINSCVADNSVAAVNFVMNDSSNRSIDINQSKADVRTVMSLRSYCFL